MLFLRFRAVRIYPTSFPLSTPFIFVQLYRSWPFVSRLPSSTHILCGALVTEDRPRCLFFILRHTLCISCHHHHHRRCRSCCTASFLNPWASIERGLRSTLKGPCGVFQEHDQSLEPLSPSLSDDQTGPDRAIRAHQLVVTKMQSAMPCRRRRRRRSSAPGFTRTYQ